MESCDFVYDEKTIIRALQVVCDLGSDGGIRKGRIWFRLDERMRRTKISDWGASSSKSTFASSATLSVPTPGPSSSPTPPADPLSSLSAIPC